MDCIKILITCPSNDLPGFNASNIDDLLRANQLSL